MANEKATESDFCKPTSKLGTIQIEPEGIRDLRTGPLVYWRVFRTFVRNSLVRAMGFRANFWLECVSSVCWTVMNLVFFKIVFTYTDSIGRDTGWGENEFFVFLGTTWIITSLIQTFVMPNAQEFSELIRTGQLDFALLKPIDTQFLISFPQMVWSNLANLFLGVFLVIYSVYLLTTNAENPLPFGVGHVVLYVLFLGCGLAILYSVMIAMAATSIWLGRNQTLYTFWFYLTNFYRQPMEIYQQGFWGWALWGLFTFVVPILLVVNVPARILAEPLRPGWDERTWALAGLTVLATCVTMAIARFVFQAALASYRSASS
ncbi:MAG: ABC-2 family transporter protein [Planctomycetaceae bacterium]|nr:ABC-2 family transporter protein [Planctomycetaceae bacterium]